MKNRIRYVVIFVAGISSHLFAQSSASAGMAATIVTPIAITKSVDMAFGNIAATTAPGTVILSTDGTRIPTEGITLPSSSGSPSAASFIVTGSGSYTYTITLPSSPISLNGITTGVTVGSFVSNPAPTGTLISGSQTIKVGGVLTIPASAAADTYKNISGLTVTVNYN